MNWASCSTSRVESSTKLLASFWDSCAKQPVPVRLAGHQTPPLNWARLPVYAACSWGHVVNVPHFLGGLWKKNMPIIKNGVDSMNSQGTSSSQMTFIKDLGAPVGQAIAPEKANPNCRLFIVNKYIVYDIPVDWLATIYIYMQKHERKISVVKIYEYSYSRLSLG